METVLEQHQAAAGLVQEGHRQQLEFYCSGHPAGGGGAGSTSAVEETAVGDSWRPDVEEEYIDVKEAVDADLLSYDNAGTAAAEFTSESSSDEAAAGEDADMTEEISADTALDNTTACASPSAATSLDTNGDPVSSGAASADYVDISAANSAAVSSADLASSRLRTSLETVLKGARDAICCATVGTTSVCGKGLASTGQQHQQVNHVLLAALGSCDDACRLYLLPAEAQPQQRQHASANTGTCGSFSTGGSNNITSSRSRQKRNARQGMEAAATLRDGHETVSAAAFSFDSRLLACGCFDGVVRVYRPHVAGALGPRKATTPSSCGLKGGGNEVSPALSGPPGAAVVLSEAQEMTAQHVRDAEPAGAIADSTALPRERGAKASPEEQVILSVDLAEELRGCAADVVDLSFHPRGYAIIVASADQTAWIWLLPLSLVNGSSLKEPGGGARAVVLTVYAAAAPLTCCCFSSSGREGIVGAVDGSVSVFTAKTGALLYTVKHPGLSVSLRQRQQQELQEPCSVLTLRLSSTCITQPASLPGRAAACGNARAAVVESSCTSGLAAAGRCVAAEDASISKIESSTSERQPHEDVLLGVGYEDGWVALIRAAAGDVIFVEQGHAQKAVESVAFIRLAGGVRRTAARATEGRAGSTCSYLFASGGLDGRVVIWDVAHKCVRAVVAAPVFGVGQAVDGNTLQPEPTAAPGVTRLLVLQESHLNVCQLHAGLQQPEETYEHQWVQQRQRIRQLQAEQQQQQEAALICAGSTDGLLFVLDVRAGQLLYHWQAHAGAVMDLTALPPSGATSAKEEAALAEPHLRAAAGGTEGWPTPFRQQHGFDRCCCCWRVLSAGDDGIGKVWRIFIS